MDTHNGPNASLPPTTTRRTMTLTLGVAAAVLLAGCSSSGGKPESTGSGMASGRAAGVESAAAAQSKLQRPGGDMVKTAALSDGI